MELSTIILAASLVLIMFGMGLNLTKNDFRRVFYEPKAIFIGLLNQLILLPAFGFFLISIFSMRVEIAVGIIILAACPGGPTSNLITHLAKGDAALSVSLTAISSFITLLTIPFVVNLGLQIVLGKQTNIQLNVIETIIQVFVIVVIPVSLGMIIQAKNSETANKMRRPFRVMSAVVFVLVLLGVIFAQKENIVPYFRQAGLYTLLLNLMTMGTAIIISTFAKLSSKQGLSVSIESGIQNGTLAIVIAGELLKNLEYAIAPAVYSLVMFITGIIVIFWGIRKDNIKKI